MKRRALLTILLMVFVACISVFSFGCKKSSDDEIVQCNVQMYVDKREWFKEDFIAHWDAACGTGRYFVPAMQSAKPQINKEKHELFFVATPEEMGINYYRQCVIIYTVHTDVRREVSITRSEKVNGKLKITVENEKTPSNAAGACTPYQKFFIFVIDGTDGYSNTEITYI